MAHGGFERLPQSNDFLVDRVAGRGLPPLGFRFLDVINAILGDRTARHFPWRFVAVAIPS
jgi:hypothetical protein